MFSLYGISFIYIYLNVLDNIKQAIFYSNESGTLKNADEDELISHLLHGGW